MKLNVLLIVIILIFINLYNVKVLAQESNNLCDGGIHGFIKNPKSCKHFHYCSFGVLALSGVCPGEQLFNEKDQKCDVPENVVCENIVTETEVPDYGEPEANDDAPEYEDEPESNPNNPCYGKNDGFIESQFSCQDYYYCVNSVVYSYGTCSGEYIFSEKKQMCDFPENADCGKIVTDTTPAEISTNYPNNDSTTIEMTISYPINVCDGYDFVFVTDSESCQHYYYCVNGVVHSHGKCPDKYWFNEKYQMCVLPENSDCGKIVTDTPLNESNNPCYGEGDGIISDPNSCQHYYHCLNGQVESSGACPDGYFFDSELHSCDVPENVDCGHLITDAPINEPNNPCYGKDDGFISNPESCQHYYHCLNGVATSGVCPNDYLFNVEAQMCDFPGNVECVDVITDAPATESNNPCYGNDDGFIKNPESCQHYYHCLNGVATSGVCPNDYLFNVEAQMCDFPGNVECGDVITNAPVTESNNPCSGKDDGFITNPESCQHYYHCLNGVATSGVCPNDYLFNVEAQMCDFPGNVECVDGFTDAPVTESNNPCYGKNDGFITNPESCQHYYHCLNGVATSGVCPNDYLFNVEAQMCDFPGNVECVDGFTDAPVTESNNPCYGKNDGFITNPESCQHYYHCLNGVATSGVCPNDYLFNVVAQMCDFPGNVECVDETEVPVGDANNPCYGKDDGFITNPESCQHYYHCLNGVATSGVCPNDYLFNVEAQMCDFPGNVECGDVITDAPVTESNNPCYGKDDGFISNPESCQHYYHCLNGVATSGVCPNDYLFNVEAQMCDFPGNVECVDVITDAPATESNNPCYGNDDGFIKNPESCQHYYHCLNGVATSGVCPNDYLFNVEAQMCDFPGNVECGDVITNAPVTESNNPCSGKDDGFITNPESCQHYYHCLNGVATSGVCPNDYLFNVEAQMCDFPGNVECVDGFTDAPVTESNNPCYGKNDGFITNPESCQHYYHCLNGVATSGVCPNDYLFNVEAQMCDFPGNVECVDETEVPVGDANNPCYGKDDGFITNPESCQHYYHCLNGVATSGVCPNDYLFNVEAQMCDFPGNVECGDVITDAPVTESNNPCYGKDDGFITNPESCQHYYHCLNGVATSGVCPNDYLFNVEAQMCDFPGNVECADGFTDAPVTESNNPCYGKNDGFITNPESCQHYYHCLNGVTTSGVCPNDYLFNVEAQMCDFPGNVECGDVITDAPVTESNNPCSGKDDGFITNPESCQHYYHCLNGVATSGVCPNDYLFNVEAQMCDFPGNVECVDETEVPIGDANNPCYGKDDGFITNPESCQHYYHCLNGVATSGVCPNDYLFNVEAQMCDFPGNVECVDVITDAPVTESNNPCYGKNDGFITNPESCQHYYHCLNGVATPGVCPNDYLFNVEAQMCDFPGNVECVDGFTEAPVTESNNPCYGKNDGFITNPESCQHYYHCLNGVATSGVCPNDYLFNVEAQMCDFPGNVECGDVITDAPVTESNNPCSGKDDGFITNPESCQHYYHCLNGVATSGVCPNDYLFNVEAQMCDFPGNVECVDETEVPVGDANNPCSGKDDGFISNPESCQQFYHCLNNEVASSGACTGDYLFNVVDQLCDYPENVNCEETITTPIPDPNNPCSGKDDGFISNPESCQHFYHCLNNEVASSGACTGDYLFNVVYQLCDYPENVNCEETITTLIPDPYNPCSGKDDGFISNPESCQHFYHCLNNEVASSGACTGDYLFNVVDQLCDYAENVNCEETITTPIPDPNNPCSGKDDGFISNPESCQHFYHCLNNEVASSGACTGDYLFNVVDQLCDYAENVNCEETITTPIPDPNNPCSGKDDGFISNPESCQHFYHCLNNEVASSGACTGDYLFNVVDQLCDYAENVNCEETITTPTPDPNDACYGKDDGFITNPESCQHYYHCLNGVAEAGECPEGYSFDIVNQDCDIQENVNCNVTIITSTPDPIDPCYDKDDGFITNPESCQHYYHCLNGVAEAGVCPEDYLFDIVNQYCDIAENVYCEVTITSPAPDPNDACYGKDDGFITNPESCQHYYHCLNGVAEAGECPEGYLFDIVNQYCDIEENVNCNVTIITSTPDPIDPCYDKDDGFITNPESCQHYYHCLNGVAEAGVCPEGYLFDIVNQYCDIEENVNCNVTIITSTPDPIDPCYDKEDGFITNPETCQHYYHCLNGVAEAGVCPEGYLFDIVNQYCDIEENVDCVINTTPAPVECPPNNISFIENADNCEEYILCFDGNKIPQKCSPGLFFDSETNTCTQPENALCFREKCPSAINDPENIVFLAHPSNCEKYFICYSGIPLPFNCSPGVNFNPNTLTCDLDAECSIG